MDDKIVDTGITFKGYPVLLGPRNIDHNKADKFVLTQLDRFLRKHFPSLYYLVANGKTFVRGALPLKENQDDQS